MKVSVVIPTYRSQAYLWECLDALRAQTLPSESWEVILVLNGEENPYRAQIEEYISKYAAFNWRFIYTSEPGVSHARNLGLEAAIGDYICFIDDDDYVSPTYLEALLSAAEPDADSDSDSDSDSDAKAHAPIMSLSNLLCFNDGEKNIYPDHISGNFQRIKNQGLVGTMQARQYLSGPVAKLVAREYALRERFNPRFSNGEDALYIFALSRFYKQYRSTTEDAVYYRRVRGNSARFKLSSRLASMFSLLWAYVCLWIKHPLQYHFILFASRFLAVPKGIWKIYRAKLKK